MTKFVLHGGFSREKAPVQENDLFFQEMMKDAPEDSKILLVYFAEREEMIELRINQDHESFNKNRGTKRLIFKIATQETFIEDCKWADVIYLHGGKTTKLMSALSRYQNLGLVFKDKTIGGDSAGANALGRLFYSKNSQEIGEGLGILPIKILVHYVEGATNPLAELEPNLETLFLHEYEVKVFYLNESEALIQKNG